MARAKVLAASPAIPWWLTDGDEECPSCGQLYVYEMEFRCPECEVATCIHCRRRHGDGRLICVACSQTAAGGSVDAG